MTRLLKYILITAAVVLSACSDEPERDYGDFLEAFVTYKGNKTLTYQPQNDSPTITLIADRWNEESIKQGERAVIRYTVIEQTDSHSYNVKINAADKLYSDVLRQASVETIKSLNPQPIKITSLWRSGEYINLNSWVPHVAQGAKISLIADEKTIDNDVPELYLVYHFGSQNPDFERKCYASFKIANLWNRQSCKSIKIKILTDKKIEEYVFEKSTTLR